MDHVAIETLSMRPRTPAQQQHARALEVADQFETVFVRTLVQSLRNTAKVTGDGMFGGGLGADTYSDWFDQNVAEELTRTGRLGIADTIVTDMQRHGSLAKEAVDEAAERAATARRSADAAPLRVTTAMGKATLNGGFDVVL